ncbi:MAG: hypothetical protein KKA84_13295 [Bacteroidetes bacterium]|nr:hypothetical protein [Bacteroidota bacterium]
MELIPILSLIILVATISTFMLAVGAYILYKVRERKGNVAQAPQPAAIPAELVTPTSLMADQRTTHAGTRRTYTGEQYITRDGTGEYQRFSTNVQDNVPGPDLRPTYVGEQQGQGSAYSEARYTKSGATEDEKYQPKKKFMRYTQEGYSEPLKDKIEKKKKDEDGLRWR